jgi:hypothetical protein
MPGKWLNELIGLDEHQAAVRRRAAECNAVSLEFRCDGVPMLLRRKGDHAFARPESAGNEVCGLRDDECVGHVEGGHVFRDSPTGRRHVTILPAVSLTTGDRGRNPATIHIVRETIRAR